MITETATDFSGWRERARELLAREVPPEDVLWTNGEQASLFGGALRTTEPRGKPRGARAARVPAAFMELAETVAAHGDPARFAVLYRLLWKLAHGRPEVLGDPLDPDVARARAMARDVREEEHRMHAFVRFRPVTTQDGEEHWIAWYRPAHHVLPRVAPFFARRYPAMRWSLFTPERSAHWDGEAIVYGEGAPSSETPAPDALDALFLTYYENIWNPARTNVALLGRHVPKSIQVQLPEASAMRSLPRTSMARLDAMVRPRASVTEALLPRARDLPSLAEAARSCRACPIGAHATQTVFGQGPGDARLVMVGEQPGDEEDLAGSPFVGPAGRVLADLMARAGLDRSRIYMTNAVKHFKWEPRGKRRLHARPNPAEMDACRGWLFAELEAIRPAMILCLGSTAGQTFSGRGFRVQRDRGRPTATPWAPWWMATYHPSAVLRASSDEERRAIEETLLADLVTTRAQLEIAARQGSTNERA